MHATDGSRIVIRGRTVETPDRHGTIAEVRGEDGPYLVKFDDGHESVVFPGPDFELDQAQKAKEEDPKPA